MTPTITAKRVKDPVDQVPPIPKLTILGLQHVLAFYAGAVIVPLVIAQGLGLDSATTIHLINADLFTCGIASIIQSAGLGPKIGVRLPLLQGVTFTAVSPLIAIGLAGGGGIGGLATMYGSIIVAGLATFFAAPFFAKLLRFFPPVVTGTLLTIMGTTLLSVAANDIVSWGTAAATAGGSPVSGTLRGLIYALGTLAVIVLVQWLFKGFMATISVLIGLVAGTVVAIFRGDADFGAVGQAPIFGVTTPFFFGIPKFSIGAIISMLIVMAITAVETTGDVFATGEVVGRRITSKHVANALRADGLSTALGGVLNSFPYTCFAQNVGLVRLTRVKSRWVVTMAGVIMIVLGVIPKAGAVVDAIPTPVVGGASLAMFASVAVVGIQTLRKADLHDNRNAVIVSTSVGLALLVTLKPELAGMVPKWLSIFFGSGVTLGSIVAIVLNIAFFHIGPHRSPDVARSKKGNSVNLDQVNQMDRAEFVDTFAALFTGASWPLESAWELRPFDTTTALRDALEDSVLTADPTEQKQLVRSYYDIAALVDDESGDLQARIDTGSISLDRLDDVQREELRAAATAYQERFGMPLVIAVANLATREQLVKAAWQRVEHSAELERRIAIAQVVSIADHRFTKLVADANPIRNAWSRKFEELND